MRVEFLREMMRAGWCGDFAMRSMLFVLLGWAALVSGWNVHAQKVAPVPLLPAAVAAILAQPLHQTKLADCDSAMQPTSWRNDTTMRMVDGAFEVKGRDSRGGTWSVSIPGGDVMRCEVWSAVLRRGYPEDLVFFHAEWPSEYGYELTILFFDTAGRPTPWQAAGGWTSPEAGLRTGIDQLVLEREGGDAELIMPVREGAWSSGFVYVYSLLRISRDGIGKVLGMENGVAWPVIEVDREALAGTERDKTETESFLCSEAAESGGLTLRSVLPPDSKESLVYTDGTKTRYPAMVVVDKADGSRRTIFLGGYVVDAIKRIGKGNYRLHLQGSTCEEEECRPFLLFAVER